MKESGHAQRSSEVQNSRRSSVREFSNYRSRESSVGGGRGEVSGLKIVISDDKVCCSKCHEVKPAHAVGNYVFGK